MKLTVALIFSILAVATVRGGDARAQTQNPLPGQNFYYDNSTWPLPGEGATTALRLSGMNSVHAVMMTFSRYDGGKPVTDSPVILLLEGSTLKWTAPGGCGYELQLVNANPPQINMTKPSSICALNPGARVIFKILALP